MSKKFLFFEFVDHVGLVIRKAYCIRWMLVAGVLAGIDAAVHLGVPLPFFDALPAWVRSVLIILIIAGAFVSRLLVQRFEAQIGKNNNRRNGNGNGNGNGMSTG